MKKLTKLIVCVLLLAFVLPNVAQATAVKEQTQQIICFEDGSYITVEISEIETRANSTKSGKKTYVYNSSSGDEQWRAVLSGTFTYTGTTATCTASSGSVTIANDAWYTVSKTSSKSGASAILDLTMGRKFLGITVEKKAINMKLTCDKNGNLS